MAKFPVTLDTFTGISGAGSSPRPKSKPSRRKSYPAKRGGMQPYVTRIKSDYRVLQEYGDEGIIGDDHYLRTLKESELTNILTRYGSKSDFHAQSYDKYRFIFWNGTLQLYFNGIYKITVEGSFSPGTRSADHDLYDEQFSMDPAARALALNRLYDKLKQHTSNLAIDLAELNKTHDTVKSLCDRVVGIAKAARIKNIPRFVKRISSKGSIRKRETRQQAWDVTMSKTWLEYQYGWRPLLSTIFDVAKFQSTKAKRFRVGGSAKLQVRSNFKDYPISNGLPARGTYHRVSICKIECDLQVIDPTAFDITRITSLNPIAIAWEKVPYSFVVDWFIDIGGYMSNLEASFGVGLKFVRGYRTEVNVFNSTSIVPSGTGSFYGVKALTDLKSTAYLAKKRRVILNDLPRPELPAFNPKLGWQRLLSTAALLDGILRRVPVVRTFLNQQPFIR
jgi:hypothetical protein